MSHPTSVTLLGPQRLQPIIVDALRRLEIDGPIATVTAGWQEREEEVDELREHVGREVVNLRLHARADAAFEAHPELFNALRRRQNRLKDLQRLYRRRLHPLLESTRQLLRLPDPGALIDPERQDALELVRHLDGHHCRRIAEIHDRHDALWRARTEAALKPDREELASILEGAAAVTIAGGHVAVLLNRLRLFGLPELLVGKPVIAWSAGAMACAEHIVLFHDRPPQGAGNAEILDRGLGLVPGVLPLPHASSRLQLDDPVRVGLFARRFAPMAALTLDQGDSVDCWPTASLNASGNENDNDNDNDNAGKRSHHDSLHPEAAHQYGDGDQLRCVSGGEVKRLLPDGSVAPFPGESARWRPDWPWPPSSQGEDIDGRWTEEINSEGANPTEPQPSPRSRASGVELPPPQLPAGDSP
ncbi:MAG: Type 1 glutamine amidotransferase-like domain-containing protein [Acidobacteriota bacterium]